MTTSLTRTNKVYACMTRASHVILSVLFFFSVRGPLLDGDGVVDHVEAHGSAGGDGIHSAVGADGRPVPACWAQATSGVPAREHLFNGSICRGAAGVTRHGSRQGSKATSHATSLCTLHASPSFIFVPLLLSFFPVFASARRRKMTPRVRASGLLSAPRGLKLLPRRTGSLTVYIHFSSCLTSVGLCEEVRVPSRSALQR